MAWTDYLTRYNTSVNCKTVGGRLKTFPNVPGFFDTDAHADEFAEALEDLLANNGKVTQTKVVRERVTSETTEPFTQTDAYDVYCNCIYRSAGNSDIVRQYCFPGVGVGTTNAQIEALGKLLYTIAPDGVTAVKFNVVDSIKFKAVNIVSGGPAVEKLPAP